MRLKVLALLPLRIPTGTVLLPYRACSRSCAPFTTLFAVLDPGGSVQPKAELYQEQEFKGIQGGPSLRL